MKKILIILFILFSYVMAGVVYTNFYITSEGGVAMYMRNRSGATLAKGTVVTIYTNTNSYSVKVCTNSTDPIGVTYANILNNASGWIVVYGNVDVRMTTNYTTERGDYIFADTGNNAGRAYSSISLPATTNTLANYSVMFTNLQTNIITNIANVYSNVIYSVSANLTNTMTNIFPIFCQSYSNEGVNTNTLIRLTVTTTNTITNIFPYTYIACSNNTYANTFITTNIFPYTYGNVFTNAINYVAYDNSRQIGYSLIQTNSTTNNILCRILLKK